MANTEQPIWKPYPEYSFIEVNQFGEVRTVDHYVPNGKNSKRLVKGHVLKQRLRPDGYMDVTFSVNGKVINLLVHRMAATCFVPNPNNYPEVNHIDNDRINNTVSNLEWCDHQYNQDYKKNFGTSSAEVLGRPVIAVNQETSEAFWFESQMEASRQLGVNQGNIGDVIRGQRHKAKGYWFTNADENAVEKARAKFGNDIANKVEKLMNECRNYRA